MAGKPSQRTPENQEKLLQAMQDGCTKRAACAFAGISEDTLARWLKEDADFAESFTQAGDIAEHDYTTALKAQRDGGQLIERVTITGKDGSVKVIERYSRGDTRATTFWLERRKDEYAPRSKQEVSGPNGGAIEVSFTEQLTRLWGDDNQPDTSKK